jgi:TonB family protein
MIAGTLLLLALQASSDVRPAEPRYKEQPPRPASDASQWVTPDDYPEAAMVEARSGVTSVEMVIGRDGMPRTCSIRRSSGHADLDRAACSAMMARARFIPATGSDGRNRSGIATRRIRWQLPEESAEGAIPEDLAALLPPGLVGISGHMVTYVVHPDGRVSDCMVQQMGPVEASEPPPINCETLSSTPQVPAVGPDGRPVVRRMVYTYVAIDQDPSAVPALPSTAD